MAHEGYRSDEVNAILRMLAEGPPRVWEVARAFWEVPEAVGRAIMGRDGRQAITWGRIRVVDFADGLGVRDYASGTYLHIPEGTLALAADTLRDAAVLAQDDAREATETWEEDPGGGEDGEEQERTTRGGARGAPRQRRLFAAAGAKPKREKPRGARAPE